MFLIQASSGPRLSDGPLEPRLGFQKVLLVAQPMGLVQVAEMAGVSSEGLCVFQVAQCPFTHPSFRQFFKSFIN